MNMKLDIRVIIGNPPYSAGQDNQGDDNQNLKFEADDLAASNRDSINRDARQEERDEVASVYSELDQSMR